MSKSSDWKVEQVSESDLDQIIALEKKSFKEDIWNEEFIRRVFKEHPQAFFMVRDGSKLIGFVSTAESWNLPNYNFKGKTGFVDNIAVEESYRGRGVGSALIKKAIEVLKARGAKKISTCTRVSNKPMQVLAGKFGFRNIGISPDDQYPDGEEAYSFELKL